MTAQTTDPSPRHREPGASGRIALSFVRALRMIACVVLPPALRARRTDPAETRVTPAVWPNDPVKLQHRDRP